MPRADFSISQILTWADAHHTATGRWPTEHSGGIPGAIGETWSIVDRCLRLGERGLPGRSSLSNLLAARRGKRNIHQLPNLTEEQLLAWADEHYQRTGSWPTRKSGVIPNTHRETWQSVDGALHAGSRGLTGGSSLAQLLAARRGARNRKGLPALTEAQIITWAEAHHRRTGKWPTANSGAIADAPGETWLAVAMALRNGLRGLPGGSSLSQILAERRGPASAKDRPTLTIEQILAWADAWHARTGEWPILDSGPIPEAPGETWMAINRALRYGRRGLPGGSSLGRLLAEHRGARRTGSLPKLSLNKILAWVDAHRRRMGQWPNIGSGPIVEAPGETWAAVDAALLARSRGLRVRSSLAKLLAQYRGKRYHLELLPLSYKKIMAWVEAHRERTGKWPNINSGPIPESPGDTWRKIDGALRQGLRGLRGGESLARLLARKRRVPNPASLPDLIVEQVLAWADAYHQRTGRWPTLHSGPIAGAAGETWQRVDWALRHGKRGLPRGGSLARFLAERRGARNRTNLPHLVPEEILAWARAHHQRTGRRPTQASGPESPHETWLAINHCLRGGGRGLTGGSSLARFLAEHAKVGTTELISEPRTDRLVK